jgi:hypothetical protein
VSEPVKLADYPNAAGILLAQRVAVALDSRAPIVLLADILCGEPWQLDYPDATRVVAAALRQYNGKGDPADV